MTSGVESFVLGLCTLWFMAAGGLEAWLRYSNHPRQYVYSWLIWTPLAMLFVGSVAAGNGANGVVVVVVTLLAGLTAYPVTTAMMGLYLRMNQPGRQEVWDDLQRMRYRPTDFGRDDEAPPRA